MVFIVWELGTTLFTLTHFLLETLTAGTLPAITTLVFIVVLAYGGWRSTDTPDDIPAPPQPPFLITIRPTNSHQNTIHDIRLFSPQPFLSRLIHNIHATQSPRNAGNTTPPLPSTGHTLLLTLRHFATRLLRSLTTYTSHLHLTSWTRLFRLQQRMIPSGNTQTPSPQRNGDREGTSEHTDRRSEVDSTELGTPLDQRNRNEGECGGAGGHLIRFTIKFLNDTQQEVVARDTEKIGHFKRRHFSQELKDQKTVRLIFNGRVIDETLRLKDVGIFEDCVVHCLTVSPTSPPAPPRVWSGAEATSGHNGRGSESGLWFVGFVGLLLLALWLVCFHFGQQLFAPSAVVSLSVLTGIFLIGVVAFYLPVHPTPNRP